MFSTDSAAQLREIVRNFAGRPASEGWIEGSNAVVASVAANLGDVGAAARLLTLIHEVDGAALSGGPAEQARAWAAFVARLDGFTLHPPVSVPIDPASLIDTDCCQ